MFLRTTLVLLTLSFALHAEVKLTENDVIGTWQIDSESANSDGTRARQVNTTWSFLKDGNMEAVTLDADVNARSPEMRVTVTYTVEDGKIVKQTVPGRSKFESCTAFEKSEQKMVLECNKVYYFMTKK